MNSSRLMRARNLLVFRAPFFVTFFTIVGLLALGYWGVEVVTARRYQAREMRRFVSERQSEPARRIYPVAGSTVAMLIIPRLGLSTVVVEGTGERELKLGPGHIPGTSLPGDGGNVGVAGHRDTFFRPLRLIHTNDTIKVVTPGHEYQYNVVSTEVVAPGDVHVLYPTEREALTLVTCYPFNFVGSAPRRFIVRAVRAD